MDWRAWPTATTQTEFADWQRVEKFLASTVPMRRFATDEIADAAVFLCSDRANFITGAVLYVDGGQTCS
jgi:3-oxoacyl-[acyl-carrier protein] reductase